MKEHEVEDLREVLSIRLNPQQRALLETASGTQRLSVWSRALLVAAARAKLGRSLDVKAER